MKPEEKAVDLKELEAKLLKDQQTLANTYLFWKRLMNEKTSLLAKFNENPENYSEEEILQVESDIRCLINKATWEISAQKRHEAAAHEFSKLKKKEQIKRISQAFKKGY
jgi:hypothetical protein